MKSKSASISLLLAVSSFFLTTRQVRAQKFTASPPPKDGNALIYIYRPENRLSAGSSNIIFVNNYLLAVLHHANYATIEVPQGKVVITGTRLLANVQVPSTTAYWTTLPGCNELGQDWRRFLLASPADITLCYNGLTDLYARCHIYRTFMGSYQIGSTTTIYIPNCNSNLNGLGDAPFLLSLAVLSSREVLPLRFEIDVESGKTYFLKWTTNSWNGSSPVKLVLVDAVKGAKEIKGLNLAKVP
jgi:hypothetical protein